MMDYRSTKRSLCDTWLRRREAMQEEMRAAFAQHEWQWNEPCFARALYQHARGNSQLLIDYLRSDALFSANDREQCAQVLEGVLERNKSRGRPRNSLARAAAMQSRIFYKMWRKKNKEAGIRDHGYGDKMKDDAVRFVIEDFEPHLPPLDFETVRGLMDRPESRR